MAAARRGLPLQAAGAAADAYPQGVWWVPLAAIADPAGVVQAVGRALGASGRLAGGIGDRRLLLLLDNFEHVIEASGELSELLADCPNVDLLVTSRERLRIAGEQVYPVPVLARAEARELFATRARALRPDFSVDESVEELCERLDDLPLALELAAARTLMLTGKQLVERLGSRLDLLRGGRDADRRQQTLRATIEWSHDLLEPDEQELFGRLAVFVGGCTLAAAEEICGADLDSLQSLVEKSLVRVRDVGRFWMLETIRELALERLAASGNEATLRDAHAAWFYELALEANLAEDARGSNHRYDLVLPEGANLRAAIDWTDARDEVERALSLVVELENYWITQDVAEGGRRVRGLLARGEISPRLRARAQRLLSGVTSWVNDPDGAAEALSLSLDGFRSLGDEAGVARVLQRSAGLALSRGELEEARRLMSQVQELLPRVRAPRLEAQVPGMLSQIERQSGNPEKALELCLESARKAGEIGFTWWEATHLTLAGEIAAELGRADEAALLFRRALLMHHAIRDRVFTAFVIASFAALAAEGGDADRAGVLWGAFESEDRRSPWEWPEERDALERRVRGVPRQARSERTRADARRGGRLRPLRRLGLNGSSVRLPRVDPAPRAADLTVRSTSAVISRSESTSVVYERTRLPVLRRDAGGPELTLSRLRVGVMEYRRTGVSGADFESGSRLGGGAEETERPASTTGTGGRPPSSVQVGAIRGSVGRPWLQNASQTAW